MKRILGMMLPGIVGCQGDAIDHDSNVFSPEDPTYYLATTDVYTSPVKLGPGTFFPCGVEDYNVHLNRAWRTRGWGSARFFGTAVITPVILGYSGGALSAPDGFDFTLTESEPSAYSMARQAQVSGTPNRSYIFGDPALKRITGSTDYVPGMFSNGNVTRTHFTSLNWTMPPNNDGFPNPYSDGVLTDVSYSISTGINVYMYDVDGDSHTIGTSTGTTELIMAFWVTGYGQSVCPIRSDGHSFPILFYLGVKIGIYPRNFAPRYAAFDAGGDAGAVEDATSSPDFGSFIVETLATGATLTSVPDPLPASAGLVKFLGSVMTDETGFYADADYATSPGDGVTLEADFTDEFLYTA